MFVPQLLTVLVGTAPAMVASGDPHSYANTAEVVVSRIALDLGVDFDARRLVGTAELSLDWKDPAARQVVLDTRDLDIGAVEAIDATGSAKPAVFALDQRDPILGSALRIRLESQSPGLRIRYKTSPDASGLQWMLPAQTAGKQHPFMFSQSESIHARSWVPLEDTPSVRFT
ncbi:MAG: aminopeptidase, partial [Rhodanobacteraceae bacterium]